MEYVIIVATVIVVSLISWLAYRQLRKSKEILFSCFAVSGFWLGIDLLLAAVLLWTLFSGFALSKYPTTTFVLQCVFIFSFACSCFILCYGLYYNDYRKIKEEFDV